MRSIRLLPVRQACISRHGRADAVQYLAETTVGEVGGGRIVRCYDGRSEAGQEEERLAWMHFDCSSKVEKA